MDDINDDNGLNNFDSLKPLSNIDDPKSGTSTFVNVIPASEIAS